MPQPVLRIDDLHVSYRDRGRSIRAADGVSLALQQGSTLALVGESGCGKTTIALAILNLLPFSGVIESGRVLLDGRNVLSMASDDLRRVRGSRISMIFQDPIAGLNPVIPIGAQVEEIVWAHHDMPKRESRKLTVEALRRQGLPRPERMMDQFPFELSGGMCQRVMIAIATILKPQVIIADEPTSALDVTVQAAILRELNELKQELGASILLITHDLGVVAQMADEVAVMYAGRIVEQSPVREIYTRPAHPYTAALLATRPRLDGDRRPLQPIRGAPPDLGELTGECAFLARCTKAVSQCRTEAWPALTEISPAHVAACYNPVFHAERV
jgi:oligopeptide/dipeptide ABC transporter ATP-binding protein